MPKLYIFTLLFFAAISLREIRGHGKLLYPKPMMPGWQICGGPAILARNKGMCGVCGESYNVMEKRLENGYSIMGSHEIRATWDKGQEINVKIRITAPHYGGDMWFYICDPDRPFLYPDESCFKKLELADCSGTTFTVGDFNKEYDVAVMLPDNVECARCVFRWIWRARATGEKFHACSIVRIGDPSPPPVSTAIPTEGVTAEIRCYACCTYKNTPGTQEYCDGACTTKNRLAGMCHRSHCCCGDECDDL